MKDIRQILVTNDNKIKDVIEAIDRGAKGIALLVDEEDRLIGTITDGDIRRAFLKNVNQDAPASTLLDYHTDEYIKPTVAAVGMDRLEILDMMRSKSIRQVPIVDENGCVVDLVIFSDLVDGIDIPLSVPEIRGNELTYLKECIDTNWVSSVGSYVNRFESAVKDYLGTKFAVSTINGTAALHTALLTMGIQPDDEVLVPALTFIAPANTVRYVGAWPVFMDVDPVYFQIDPEKISDFFKNECRTKNGVLINKTSGRRVRAILPVHLLGHPVDIDPILEIAQTYEVLIIEDSSESIGSRYKGKRIGCFGDVACFSFNGNKIITAGGGGMLVTNSEDTAQKAMYLTTQAKDDSVEYIHNEVGYNYRLTNIQASIGFAQMEMLDEFIEIKRRIAKKYTEALTDIPGITPMAEAEWAFSTFWLYTILVNEDEYGMDSRTLLALLSEHKIQTRPLWQTLSRSKAHNMCQAYRVDNADKIHRQALSLPSSVGIKDEEIERVVDVIKVYRR